MTTTDCVCPFSNGSKAWNSTCPRHGVGTKWFREWVRRLPVIHSYRGERTTRYKRLEG